MEVLVRETLTNPLFIALALLVMAVGCGGYTFWHWEKPDLTWLNYTPHRRGKMLRRARRRFVEAQAIDDFVNAIEERVYHGAYTRDEAKELYRNFKKCFPVKDLFPSEALLKEAIKHRLENGSLKPVPLPDKNKPRNAFSNPRKLKTT